METSRRGLITGLVSFAVFSPAIVRATSLDLVKGVLLDPKLLAYEYNGELYESTFNERGVWFASRTPACYNDQGLPLKLKYILDLRSKFSDAYRIVRKSEIDFDLVRGYGWKKRGICEVVESFY